MAPPAAETKDSEQKETTTDPFIAIGVPPVAASVALIGTALAIIGGFLSTLYQVQDSPGQGLGKTALWFIWIGFTLTAAALAGGGLMASSARAGVRIAMIAIGLFILLSVTNPPAILPNFPGS